MLGVGPVALLASHEVPEIDSTVLEGVGKFYPPLAQKSKASVFSASKALVKSISATNGCS